MRSLPAVAVSALAVLALSVPAGTQDASVDPAAVDLLTRAGETMLDQTSFHAALRGAGVIGPVADAASQLSLEGLAADFDISLAPVAVAGNVSMATMGLEVGLRFMNDLIYIQAPLIFGDEGWNAFALEQVLSGFGMSDMTDLGDGFESGDTAAAMADIDPAMMLGAMGATVVMGESRECGLGSCDTIHIELLLDQLAAGAMAMAMAGDELPEGMPADLDAETLTGLAAELGTLRIDLAIEPATARLDTITVASASPQLGDFSLALVLSAYDTDFGIQMPDTAVLLDLETLDLSVDGLGDVDEEEDEPDINDPDDWWGEGNGGTENGCFGPDWYCWPQGTPEGWPG